MYIETRAESFLWEFLVFPMVGMLLSRSFIDTRQIVVSWEYREIYKSAGVKSVTNTSVLKTLGLPPWKAK